MVSHIIRIRQDLHLKLICSLSINLVSFSEISNRMIGIVLRSLIKYSYKSSERLIQWRSYEINDNGELNVYTNNDLFAVALDF